MKKLDSAKGHASMFTANFLWGCLSPVSKALLAIGLVLPVALTTFRMVGAAIVFWIASFFMKKEHVNHRDLGLLFFASLLGVTFNQGSFIFGLAYTSPIDASIVTTTAPIITMIISAIYLKEPVTGKKVLGIFMGALGALILVISSNMGDVSAAGKNKIWGDLLCLFAQICFSCYIVFFKDLVGRYSPVTIMKWMFTYASICFIPFSFSDVSAINYEVLPKEAYYEIAYIVLLGTFVPYFLIPVGQKILRPTVASMYNYVQPIVAALLAIMWGMDTFGWSKAIAVFLIFSGVYVVTQSRTKQQVEEYENTHLPESNK